MVNDLGQRDILVTCAKLLEKYKIPYLLTGSFAVSYHGFIRATHDIDFILEIDEKSFGKIKNILTGLGSEYDYSLADVKDAIRKSSQFNLYHLPTGFKIDYWIAKMDDFNKNKFERCSIIRIRNQNIPIISAEDLILNKLKWSREVRSERHLRDCWEIIKFQGEKLDKKYLGKWVKKLDLEKLYKEVLSTNSNY